MPPPRLSSQGRYRKLHVKLWADSDFRALSDLERNVYFYGLAGPQTNRLGFYRLSLAQMAEDLDRALDSVTPAFGRVCATFGWQFDNQVRVLWLPDWWRYNAPENPNVLKGALNDLSEVPCSVLLDQFLANVADLEPAYRQHFAATKRSPKRSRNVSVNVREPRTRTGTGAGTKRDPSKNEGSLCSAPVPADESPSRRHDDEDHVRRERLTAYV
jgi:hypothetical protein